MAIPGMNTRQLFAKSEQSTAPEQTEARVERSLRPAPEKAVRDSGRSAHHPVHQLLTTPESIITAVNPDEVLIADPRGGLTPVQMVERKLMALLGRAYRGLFRQASGRPGNKG
jgi:hypothetical protein